MRPPNVSRYRMYGEHNEHVAYTFSNTWQILFLADRNGPDIKGLDTVLLYNSTKKLEALVTQRDPLSPHTIMEPHFWSAGKVESERLADYWDLVTAYANRERKSVQRKNPHGTPVRLHHNPLSHEEFDRHTGDWEAWRIPTLDGGAKTMLRGSVITSYNTLPQRFEEYLVIREFKPYSGT